MGYSLLRFPLFRVVSIELYLESLEAHTEPVPPSVYEEIV